MDCSDIEQRKFSLCYINGTSSYSTDESNHPQFYKAFKTAFLLLSTMQWAIGMLMFGSVQDAYMLCIYYAWD